MGHSTDEQIQSAANKPEDSSHRNDAPVAISKQQLVSTPPPPAKFNKRKPGAVQGPRTLETRAPDVALMQQMKRGVYESIVIKELCTISTCPMQEDLWASIESSFWQ
jgi:hypothetical protein